jgi:DNA-binding response OmpR family regulator
MKEDTIEGFNAGGDDYITKPFSMEELMVRINAVLRRSNKNRSQDTDESTFSIGKYSFNSEKQLLLHNATEQKLTTKESQLLRLLCVHKNDVLDRNFALKTIWHDDNYFNGRSMDVYIAKLRKYLKDDPKVEIINIHGKGFKLLVNS